jgi:(2Fe-2S) ferredoxin
MSLRDRYVLVCTNRRPEGHPKGSCGASGADAIRARLKEMVAERGLADSVRVIGTTCLGVCEEGPVVAVFPEDVWYGKVRAEDLERIVEEHLAGGRPVESLRLLR